MMSPSSPLFTLLTLFLTLLYLSPPTSALHASEAGVIDWHKQFIGVPLQGPAAGPVFHRVNASVAKAGVLEVEKREKTVIVTGTAANLLAGLDPESGDVLWRYFFEDADPLTTFRVHNDVVTVLSGMGGSTLRTLNVLTGDLIIEKRLHKPELGKLFDPADLGSHIVFPFASSDDALVLTEGYVLRGLDVVTGQEKWKWSAEDHGSLVIHSKTIPTPDAIYLVGLSKNIASYTLHINIISPSTGELIGSGPIPSNILNGLTDFMVLSDDSASARVAWLEQGTLKSVNLTPSLTEKPVSVKSASFKALRDVGLREKGYFVALKDDGTARVMKLSDDGKNIKGISEFAESASSSAHSESMFVGGVDISGLPYISRVYWSHTHMKAMAHAYYPHASKAKDTAASTILPFDTLEHGVIAGIAVDVGDASETGVHSRMLVTTSTGSLQLYKGDQVEWTREESLSAISVAEFVELPEAKTVLTHVDLDGESFITRLTRQLSDARDFPTYLVNFIKRFATGSYASASSSAALDVTASGLPVRDTFGFRKIIVAATPADLVFGIDSSNGAILWRRRMALGWAEEVGGRHQPVKLFVTRTVSDGGDPQVVLLTQRLASNGLVDTVAFHIDVMTGAEVGVDEPAGSSGLLQGKDLIQGELVDAFLLPEPSKVVLAVDKYMQVYVYPETDQSREVVSNSVRSLHFPLRAQNTILGHQLIPTIENTGRFTAYVTWRNEFPDEESILSTIARPIEPVASLGKVLGNKNTLYKYLNPHLIAVLTKSSSDLPTCGIYLMDGAKGTTIYHTILPSVDGACDVKLALTENWLVYTYYDPDVSGSRQAKGHRIVSVELYEGQQPNDKTRSSELSIYSNATTDVSTYEQSYILPAGVDALAITSTKFGITMKDVIIANARQQVQSVQKRVLDPRRPNRKPTSEEMEEWLFQYDPLIPDDPRRIISHNYQVAQVKKIITSPALLESTSLIFAYGLDLFFTRVAPSNTFDVLSENFNKAQLVLTISGLAIAILITRPMLQKKKLREKWY